MACPDVHRAPVIDTTPEKNTYDPTYFDGENHCAEAANEFGFGPITGCPRKQSGSQYECKGLTLLTSAQIFGGGCFIAEQFVGGMPVAHQVCEDRSTCALASRFETQQARDAAMAVTHADRAQLHIADA